MQAGYCESNIIGDGGYIYIVEWEVVGIAPSEVKTLAIEFEIIA
jgi:hypothetical protein